MCTPGLRGPGDVTDLTPHHQNKQQQEWAWLSVGAHAGLQAYAKLTDAAALLLAALCLSTWPRVSQDCCATSGCPQQG